MADKNMVCTFMFALFCIYIKNFVTVRTHYENMPIQMYWKFYHQKMKIFREKNLIFFIFPLKT